jgi:mono/diheme cytochrome c family protein
MRPTPENSLVRRPLAIAGLLLVLGALAIALAVGCGSKGGSMPSPTNESTSTTPPPADTTGGAVDTGVVSADLGARVFKARCALCHGPDGHGDGPASKALNPKPRNFHDVAYMGSKTDAELLATIHSGKGAMPKWSGVLSEEEMRAALAYVRTFATKP